MTTDERAELDALTAERSRAWHAFKEVDTRYEALRQRICRREVTERRESRLRAETEAQEASV